MTPDEQWIDFLRFYLEVRWLQRYYRRTLDPMTRRELPLLEQRLDVMAQRLKEDFGIATATPPAPPFDGSTAAAVKGGVS